MRRREKSSTLRYTSRTGLVLFVFVILLLTVVISGVITLLISRFTALIPAETDGFFPYFSLILVALAVPVGTGIAALTVKRPLLPFHELIEATQKIAAGEFDVQIQPSGSTEIRQLGENFNRMARELAGMETLHSDFVSNVSHEFKTPIVSIKGFAKILQSDDLSPQERSEYLEIIIRESDRLSQLAENVLLLGKLETREALEGATAYALDEQLREAVLLLAPQWEKKDLRLDIDLEPVELTGNRELLQQVWLNLLGNAIKYTDRGGTVAVAARREPGAAVVEVSDTGRGMDRETQLHAFDKFYQGDRSRSTEGNGLGLALVRRIIDLSGGSLNLESSLGEGTTVVVRLPDAGFSC